MGSWLSAAPDAPLGLALAGHPGVPRPQGHGSGPHLEEPGSGRCALPYPCPRQPVAQTASSSLQTTTAPECQLGGSCKHTPGMRASPPVPGAARRFEHMQGPRPGCSGPRGCTCAEGWCAFLPKACGAADGSLVRAGVVRCACTRVQAELTRVCMVLTHTCACMPSPGTHTWMWAKRDPGLNKVKQGLQPRGVGQREPCQGGAEGRRDGGVSAWSGRALGGTGAPACCRPPTFLGPRGPGSLHLLA